MILTNAAVRSGDYYLFEDLDEKVELDLLHERPSAGIEDTITERKLGDKMTVEQVNYFHFEWSYICVFFLTFIKFNPIRSSKFHQKEKVLKWFVKKKIKRKQFKRNRSAKLKINAQEENQLHDLFILYIALWNRTIVSIIFVFIMS